MALINLKNLLDKSIKKAGISKNLEAFKILDEFNGVIESIFGEAVRKKIKPLMVEDGTLSVACLSSVLAEKIKTKERIILEELNRPYRAKVVVHLKFII
ncbi:MAG: hypothetical protein CMI53_00680 [Parcubacteria group bacterium]|nr:hypothetical protein [Parcubacteria group bacterium]